MVLFRSSDEGRRSGATRDAAAPEALVVPVASIDGWTLEGTPLDGVVPVAIRSELTALLHTIGIGAQTPYVTQRAADLLMSCGQDGQALAVCEAWFALPESVRAGANDRAVAKRLAKLRDRLGIRPPQSPPQPAAAALPPGTSPAAARPAAAAPAAPPASAAPAPGGGHSSTAAGASGGTWEAVRARMFPAGSVPRRAVAIRERMAEVARRVLSPQADHAQPLSATAVATSQRAAGAPNEHSAVLNGAVPTVDLDAAAEPALPGQDSSAPATTRPAGRSAPIGPGEGADDYGRAMADAAAPVAEDEEVTERTESPDGSAGADTAGGRGEQRVAVEREGPRDAGARPEDGRPEKAPPGRRTTGRTGRGGGHPRGAAGAVGPGKTRRDPADDSRRAAVGERIHTDGDDAEPAHTAATD